MPRGFGRGAGWALGFGGYPFWGPYGYGRGRGNPFPFCRWFPRWWWLYSPYGTTPYAGSYGPTIPYYSGYAYPGYMPPYGYPGYGAGYPGTAPPTGVTTRYP